MSKDVVLACADVQRARSWRVDTGRTIRPAGEPNDRDSQMVRSHVLLMELTGSAVVFHRHFAPRHAARARRQGGGGGGGSDGGGIAVATDRGEPCGDRAHAPGAEGQGALCSAMLVSDPRALTVKLITWTGERAAGGKGWQRLAVRKKTPGSGGVACGARGRGCFSEGKAGCRAAFKGVGFKVALGPLLACCLLFWLSL
eukprot:SAG11_NODE_3505_length_2407_cov_2.989601_1_plen_199_part_00